MEFFVGEIRPFAGKKPPRGWRFCDGSLVSVSEFDALFNLLGTQYGGDGVTQFALPDMRSRIPLGMSRQNPIGTLGGEEKTSLMVEHLPQHRHAPACNTETVADLPNATGGVWAAISTKGRRYGKAPGSIWMHKESIEATGGTDAHENRMPVLAISYIIAVEGIFPQRS